MIIKKKRKKNTGRQDKIANAPKSMQFNSLFIENERNKKNINYFIQLFHVSCQ